MKWKSWISLILSVVLLSSCAVTDGETTVPTQPAASHSLERYTRWIGHPTQDALAALGDAQTMEFKGLLFSLSPLTEGDLFNGIQLTTQLNDANGQVADTVWNLVQGIYKEYLSVETSRQNMHTDAEHFALMEEEEYYKNLETALEKRGAYVFDISWDISRFQTEEIRALLDLMEDRVLKETEQQFKDSTIDYIWSVKAYLNLALQVTIWDANRADVKVTCNAYAEPAAGMDLTIESKRDRYQKFFQVSYERLLEEENLRVLGYGFRTTQAYTAKTWEEIYLHGEDFVYVVDNGLFKRIYLCVDGAQYKTVYQNGAYAPWEVLTEPIAHPLPWRETTMETAITNNGSVYVISGWRMYQNALETMLDLNYDDIKALFWSKANSIYKAEYKTTEEQVVGSNYEISDFRRVLEIETITEQEAAAAIEEYKALLP